MMLLDTTFLIDLQREWARGHAGAAMRFMEKHSDEEFAISVISALEFLEGYEHLRDGEAFLGAFRKLEVTEHVARLGSRLRRKMRKRGETIGDFDILVAATALETGVGLVTADMDHFARIPELALLRYRSAPE